jgi:hypothetical protein
MQGFLFGGGKGGAVQAQVQRKEEFGVVELKICERCGSLWLRPGGSAWAYCSPCKSQVDELPLVRLKRRGRGRAR